MSLFTRGTIAITVTFIILHHIDYGVIATGTKQQRQYRIMSNRERSLNNVDYGIGNDSILRKKNRNYPETEWIPPWRDTTSPPTFSPSYSPSTTTSSPTTKTPTKSPSKPPTISPSESPIIALSASPSKSPTISPSVRSSSSPSIGRTTPSPTTAFPSRYPTFVPTIPVIVTTIPQLPTLAPTLHLGPTFSPTNPDVLNTTIYNNGGIETKCFFLPSIGTFVTEVFDIEYFLYLDGGEQGEIFDVDYVQEVVDLLERRLHDALVDVGMGCRGVDFISTKYSMVDLSSYVANSNSDSGELGEEEGMTTGRDKVGERCPIDDENAPANATSCYQVLGQLEATMWFPGRRRQRTLQQSLPFGDREAFNKFASWMDDSFESLASNNPGVLQSTFKGFVNINGFDGTVMEQPQNVGVTPTASFMGSAYAADNGGAINITFGLIVIVAGVLVLSFVIFFVVVRRRRNRRAYLEHARCVDELQLDSMNDQENPDVVDDASLFREERPLPVEYEVTMEKADHDYRTCANPTCRACLERKDPIFIATEKDKGFLENLSVLRADKYLQVGPQHETQIL